jgi:phosphorylcholine metabolism protein LicD
MNNREVSELSYKEWVLYKKKNTSLLLNSYPNYNFEIRFEIMKNVKNVVEEEGVTLYLSNGTLLGAVRQKDFIPWDKDVDMDVLAEELELKYKTIKSKLIQLGYIVRGVEDYPRMKINVYHGGEKVGILALYLKDQIRYRGPYKWPKNFYEDAEKIDFKGITFKAPKIDQYLIHQYGKNWKTPLKENYFSKDLFR